MKETSIYDFYAFGYNYNIWCTSWVGKSLQDAARELENYLFYVSNLELLVTKKIVEDLNDILADLRAGKPEDIIDPKVATKIQDTLVSADKTLDAELKIKKVLSVTPKRFDVASLLQAPRSLLANGTWGKLTETAQRDFADATRCIAMNLSTAAAFHLMRSAEECLKQLYFHYVKNGRLEKPMWGAMVDKLRQKNKPKPSVEILDHLDIIRKNYRNPTQHPQKFYTIDEAQDLLNSTIVVLNGICAEI